MSSTPNTLVRGAASERIGAQDDIGASLVAWVNQLCPYGQDL